MIYRNNNQIQGIDITLIRRKQFPSNYFNELQCYSMLNSNLRKKIIALFSLKQAVVFTGLRIYQIIHEFTLFKECASITPLFRSFYKRTKQ